jgi:hypothetical protein
MQRIIFYLAGIWFLMPIKGECQELRTFFAGVETNMIFSSQLSTSPGFGIQCGAGSQTTVAYRTEIISEIYICTGTTGVEGWMLNSDNTTWGRSWLTLIGGSAKYLIGVNYYIVPREVSISVAPVISGNAYFYPDFKHSTTITDPKNPDNSNFNSIGGWDYGINIGVTYRYDTDHQVSARYDYGFGGSNYFGNSHFNTLLISYAYKIFEYSATKKYENRMLR